VSSGSSPDGEGSSSRSSRSPKAAPPWSSGRIRRGRVAGEEAPRPGCPGDLTGSLLGRFRVLALLGKGGMGVVYLAEDEALCREVALKVLAPDTNEDPELRQRLLREARAGAALSHPNIAGVHEMGEAEGLLYIAMERVTGESLRKQIERGPLDVGQALVIVRQVLTGLAKAHEAGIVHRDIKPENIMLTEEGGVKLLDFGLAKFMDEEAERGEVDLKLTEHGRLLGSPGYMSPEQANGSPVDARSDIFSLGIVLYEMLRGEPPFRGKNFLSTLAALERDEPPPLVEKNASISPELEGLIFRCLAKDPSKRPANAGEVLAELSALQGLFPEENMPLPARPPKTRRAWPILVVFAAVIALCGASLWVFRSRRQVSTPVASASVPVSPSAAPAPTPITDLPAPKTENAAALASYREGLQALRDGAYTNAHGAFARAVELDPSFGAAYLRLAFTGIWGAATPVEARSLYRRAISYRASLGEHDKILLDALEPILQRDPPNPEEAAKRLATASARYPGDAELVALQSLNVFAPHLSPAAILQICDRCLGLDPLYADCWQPRAAAFWRLGRVEEARSATDRCLEVSPAANDCLGDRMEIHQMTGECSAMADVARRMMANDGGDWRTHRSLAAALIADGRGPEGVRATLEQGRAKAPEMMKATWKRYEDIHFALLEGRFEDAEREILAWQGGATKSPFESVHESIARELVSLYEVTGRSAEAGKVADDFLARRDVWMKSFVRMLWQDPALWYLKRELDAALMPRDAFVTARAAWVRAWEERLSPDMRGMVWIWAYAELARTAEDAKEALARAPELEPLVYYRKNPTEFEGAMGKTYLLAGRPKDALPYLTRAAASCNAFLEPIENTLAHYRLGLAREALGEARGACEAYAVVLGRWGNAKPKSAVAEDAKARARALGCGR